jgi:adenosylhomocysteine nucleosidase
MSRGKGGPGEGGSERRAPSVVAPAPVPADVGIVAALPMEVGYLIDMLRRVRRYHAASMPVIEGEYKGKIVAIAVGGMGRDAGRRAAGVLLDGHRPGWIISAGFAGALNPALERNDLALPAELTDADGRLVRLGRPESLGNGIRHVTGRLLTVDRVILDPVEKAELHRTTGADLVDMETAGVAEVCAERLIRFLSIRIVSDDARTVLPPEVASLLTKSGSYRVGAALRAIWSRPSSIKDFWRLHEHALQAADRLARFVARVPGRAAGIVADQMAACNQSS